MKREFSDFIADFKHWYTFHIKYSLQGGDSKFQIKMEVEISIQGVRKMLHKFNTKNWIDSCSHKGAPASS